MMTNNRPELKLNLFDQGLKSLMMIAACGLLAGCMAGGSSGFVDDLGSVKAEAQRDDFQAIPLDVAQAGTEPGEMEYVGASTSAPPSSGGAYPGSGTQPHVIGQPGVVAQEQPSNRYAGPYASPATATDAPRLDLYGQQRRVPEQAYGEPLVQEQQREFAALDANVTGATPPGQLARVNPRYGANSSEYQSASTGEDASATLRSDPAELQAQMRVPALFDRIDHGECDGGWGPKPRVVNATRMDPAHPYYMEMRLRQTPMLPVGHVYIAYGRLGPDGQPIDEKLIMLSPLGGYAGAAIAAAAPMPGVLVPYGDDCKLNPIAAYRVSLSAVDFEKLLLRIQQAKAKVPAYHLFQYNCNHFLSDVAKSVGILPPENIYKPSLVYFYEMMDRNEGRKVSRDYPGKIAWAEPAKTIAR